MRLKKSFIIYIALVTLAGHVPVSVCAQTKTDTLFFESFNGRLLDRTKWNVEISGRTVNNEQQAYVDSASVMNLEKGNLVIRPAYSPGYTSPQQKTYNFISGRINSSKKFEFTYGTASARIKISAGAGLWPAFWGKGEGKWPDCGEIDIMENVGDPTWVSSALHGPGYSGKTPLTHRYLLPQGMDATQWHIYSVTWTAEAVVFRVDGIITYAIAKAEVEKYGRWAYDNPKFLIINFALGGGYPKGVNKVDKPYPGLPENTISSIKNGTAMYLIDWVLVTR
jgi:beta-glucanase (GH16 family)